MIFWDDRKKKIHCNDHSDQGNIEASNYFEDVIEALTDVTQPREYFVPLFGCPLSCLQSITVATQVDWLCMDNTITSSFSS